MSALDASHDADVPASGQAARTAQAAQVANIAARLERLAALAVLVLGEETKGRTLESISH